MGSSPTKATMNEYLYIYKKSVEVESKINAVENARFTKCWERAWKSKVKLDLADLEAKYGNKTNRSDKENKRS